MTILRYHDFLNVVAGFDAEVLTARGAEVSAVTEVVAPEVVVVVVVVSAAAVAVTAAVVAAVVAAKAVLLVSMALGLLSSFTDLSWNRR